MHRALVDVVRPQVPPGSFELTGWHPHLTLRLGRGFDLDEVRAGVAELGPLPPFTVDEVWLCRQEGSAAFVPELAIPLGHGAVRTTTPRWASPSSTSPAGASVTTPATASRGSTWKGEAAPTFSRDAST